MKRPERAYMTIQAKQKYTAEFKDDAVKRANDRELCISSITGFISIAAHLNLMRQCEVIRWAETHKKDVARLTEERYLWTERQCTLRDAQDRLCQRNTVQTAWILEQSADYNVALLCSVFNYLGWWPILTLGQAQGERVQRILVITRPIFSTLLWLVNVIVEV